jgi:hypothetical protein
VKPATHVYENLRTGRARPFYFRESLVEWLWDLIEVETGACIGQFDDRARSFRMVDGLSNHRIVKLETRKPEKEEPF